MTQKPSDLAAARTAAETDDPIRAAFLVREANSLGLLWSVGIRDDLRTSGRKSQGGFPGTMQEVRRQIAAGLPVALARARMHALSTAERDWSARVAYAAARRDWNVHSDADDS